MGVLLNILNELQILLVLKSIIGIKKAKELVHFQKNL